MVKKRLTDGTTDSSSEDESSGDDGPPGSITDSDSDSDGEVSSEPETKPKSKGKGKAKVKDASDEERPTPSVPPVKRPGFAWMPMGACKPDGPHPSLSIYVVEGVSDDELVEVPVAMLTPGTGSQPAPRGEVAKNVDIRPVSKLAGLRKLKALDIGAVMAFLDDCSSRLTPGQKLGDLSPHLGPFIPCSMYQPEANSTFEDIARALRRMSSQFYDPDCLAAYVKMFRAELFAATGNNTTWDWATLSRFFRALSNVVKTLLEVQDSPRFIVVEVIDLIKTCVHFPRIWGALTEQCAEVPLAERGVKLLTVIADMDNLLVTVESLVPFIPEITTAHIDGGHRPGQPPSWEHIERKCKGAGGAGSSGGGGGGPSGSHGSDNAANQASKRRKRNSAQAAAEKAKAKNAAGRPSDGDALPRDGNCRKRECVDKPPHKFATCPRVKCNGCGKFGHLKNSCPN